MAASLAVIERRGRYLICRRRRGDFLGGFWEFPGGKRKPRESWEACLRRELREELGVAVTAIRPLCRLR
ncbi:MAG: NUDIX domain-containing protein, partial [Candidatus Omnitrophica bacterium]|nr:NUDIX domain-containing protein [Candidatus Omnitrophota bacterium]